MWSNSPREASAQPEQLAGADVEDVAAGVEGDERGDRDPVREHDARRADPALEALGVGAGAGADRALPHARRAGCRGRLLAERARRDGCGSGRRRRGRTARRPARSARPGAASGRPGSRCCGRRATTSRRRRPPARRRCHRRGTPHRPRETRLTGLSVSMSRVPGPPPRTSTAPTVPAGGSTTVVPVSQPRPLRWKWPTFTPATSVMSLRGPGNGSCHAGHRPVIGVTRRGTGGAAST